MKSILIIEDDALVRKTLTSQLAKRGFEVATAETGEDGVRSFAESSPDLVLLDVRLPDIDGLEVLRRIREKNRRAIILVMTAFDDMKTTVEAVKLGAFEYLVKKAQEHLDSLPVAPGKGNDAQATPPAGEKPSRAGAASRVRRESRNSGFIGAGEGSTRRR